MKKLTAILTAFALLWWGTLPAYPAGNRAYGTEAAFAQEIPVQEEAPEEEEAPAQEEGSDEEEETPAQEEASTEEEAPAQEEPPVEESPYQEDGSSAKGAPLEEETPATDTLPAREPPAVESAAGNPTADDASAAGNAVTLPAVMEEPIVLAGGSGFEEWAGEEASEESVVDLSVSLNAYICDENGNQQDGSAAAFILDFLSRGVHGTVYLVGYASFTLTGVTREQMMSGVTLEVESGCQLCVDAGTDERTGETALFVWVEDRPQEEPENDAPEKDQAAYTEESGKPTTGVSSNAGSFTSVQALLEVMLGEEDGSTETHGNGDLDDGNGETGGNGTDGGSAGTNGNITEGGNVTEGGSAATNASAVGNLAADGNAANGGNVTTSGSAGTNGNITEGGNVTEGGSAATGGNVTDGGNGTDGGNVTTSAGGNLTDGSSAATGGNASEGGSAATSGNVTTSAGAAGQAWTLRSARANVIGTAASVGESSAAASGTLAAQLAAQPSAQSSGAQLGASPAYAGTLNVTPADYVQGVWRNTLPSFEVSASERFTGGETIVALLDGGSPDLVSASNAQTAYTPPASLADGKHTLRFTILDAAGNDLCPASAAYSIWFDQTAPTLAVSVSGSTLTLRATDAASGPSAASVDGGINWYSFASASGGVAALHFSVTQSTLFAAGDILVKDQALNTAASRESVAVEPASQGGAGGAGGMSGMGGMTEESNGADTSVQMAASISLSGGGGGGGTSRYVSHASAGDVSTTAYNAVELAVEEQAMASLAVGEKSLDLSLCDQAGQTALFRAGLAHWNAQSGLSAPAADGDATADTLVLSAVTQSPAESAYRWEVNGQVFRKLQSSGVSYVVLQVGDSVTALPTAGFTAGLRYDLLKQSGVASKDFQYSVLMPAGGGSVQMSVSVQGQTYPLGASESDELYYYNVYSGSPDMLTVAFGAYAGKNQG